MALRQEDRHPIAEILNQTPDIPPSCQWAIFLRNHDELTLEMVTDEERDYMYQAYAADPQMRLNQGIRRRLAPLMEHSRLRIELMMGLLLSLPGTPILYYGDELGMGDNIYLGDRNGVRTPMQWTADRNAGFSRTEPARLYAPPIMDSIYGYQSVNVEAQERSQYSLLNWTRRLVALRQQHRTFGRGSMDVLQPENRRVFAFLRQYEGEDPILVVANLAGTVQPVSLDLSRFAGMVPIEMTGGTDLPRITEAPYFLTLARYGYYWLILRPEPPTPITVRSLAAASGPRPDESPLLLGPDWSHVLSGSTRELLERRYLAPFVRRQRWFGHAGEPHTTVRILDWGMLGPSTEPMLLTILATTTDGGEQARYFVPLAMATGSRAEEVLRESPDAIVARIGGARKGVLHGQLDPDTALSFLTALSQNAAIPLRAGRFVAWSGIGLADVTGGLAPEDLAPVPSTFEQSNSSIRFGAHLILKVIRRVRDGVNPELDLGRFLTEQSTFSRVPRLLGAIEYTSEGSGSSTLAVMHQAVVHQSDAWQHALGVLSRYFEAALTWDVSIADLPTVHNLWAAGIPDRARETVGGYLETAAMLGRRTAELHLALASPAAVAEFGDARLDPHVARRLQSTIVSEAEQLPGILAHLPSDTPDEVRAVAAVAQARAGDIVTAIRQAASALPPDLQLTRIHGDYHLGQVLLYEEDAYIVDFEGEPARPIEERRQLQSPMKDVAGMVRSFSYAAGAGLSAALNLVGHDRERLGAWARWWHTWSAVSFLQAYRMTAGRAGFLPGDLPALSHMLRLFLLEKAVYEARYEAAHRPAWLAIPLADLLDLIGAPPT
jgi:maltose alpha-D-glucosyltransferase/alpha-amylase